MDRCWLKYDAWFMILFSQNNIYLFGFIVIVLVSSISELKGCCFLLSHKGEHAAFENFKSSGLICFASYSIKLICYKKYDDLLLFTVLKQLIKASVCQHLGQRQPTKTSAHGLSHLETIHLFSKKATSCFHCLNLPKTYATFSQTPEYREKNEVWLPDILQEWVFILIQTMIVSDRKPCRQNEEEKMPQLS